MVKRVSVKKALQGLFVCFLFVFVYYVAVSYRHTRIVREPREVEVVYSQQKDLQESEKNHRKTLSVINDHKHNASIHHETTRQPRQQLTTSKSRSERTSTIKKFAIPHNKIEHDVSSRSKSMGRCVIDQDSIKNIRNFVFFIGYPRSGHSIIASFLDAHPHMIVAHEYSVFSKWPQFKNEHLTNTKEMLFNELTNSSHWESLEGERSGKYVNKGYSLDTSSPWHGKCDQFLEVIGDKRAGGTCEEYLNNPEEFERNYKDFMSTIQLPIRVVHVVRNPYDLIATSLLYEVARLKNGGRVSGDNAKFVSKMKDRSRRTNFTFKYTNPILLENRVHSIMRLAQAVTNLTRLFGEENVLELHNCDVVADPVKNINQLCSFNNVECYSDYVKACVDKIFSRISQSRNYVTWPAHVVEIVERYKQKFPFFERYSLNSDC